METIKTWQERMLGKGAFGNDSVFMQQEISDLRAALAKQAESAGVGSVLSNKDIEKIVRDDGLSLHVPFSRILPCIRAAIDKAVAPLNRTNLELTRRYEEQKLQEKRMETALERAKAQPDSERDAVLREMLSTGYEGGTMTDEDLGGKITLHYVSRADAENSFNSISNAIDAAMAAQKGK